ncbi:hypothetical protein L1887_18882 [Cichorium endivia]|nr:hypothetical protein L1887_18882 [Cichorium endivia]
MRALRQVVPNFMMESKKMLMGSRFEVGVKEKVAFKDLETIVVVDIGSSSISRDLSVILVVSSSSRLFPGYPLDKTYT